MAQSNETNIIATWFVRDAVTEQTFFPQTGMQSGSEDSIARYYSCVNVFYHLARHTNPGANLEFFTNLNMKELPKEIIDALIKNNVKITTVKKKHFLTSKDTKSWGNQFYVFDILEHLTNRSEWKALVLLDSDCIVRKSLDELFQTIYELGSIRLDIGSSDYNPQQRINGRTQAELAAYCNTKFGTDLREVSYSGGEIVGVTTNEASRIISIFETIWPDIKVGCENSPLEEAHALSCIYELSKLPQNSAGPFIRRIWTSLRYSNVQVTDLGLAIWHLPSEKIFGFPRLDKLIRDGADVSKVDIAKVMGLPRRNLFKFIADVWVKLKMFLMRP